MFQSAAPSRNRSTAFAGTYHTVGVETGVAAASPHQLVTMLFDGFNTAIAEARSALAQGQIEAKCKAITRALRIVDEGLKAPLDAAGGTLSENLTALYGYVTLRLSQANLSNDVAALDECVKLLEPVRSAWLAIAPAAAAATAETE
ncbi:MAG: flagellar export chaperone FliS [Caldimonas sp.]